MGETETINVVLMGVTANGKSSLIREILLYGGDIYRANNVKVGNGNISETQKCTAFPVTIPLKEHYLRSKETLVRVEPKEDLSANDVELVESTTNQSAKFVILDTPGFFDSGNASEHGLKHSRKFGPLIDSDSDQYSGLEEDDDFREKDERHKVRILKAILDLGKVHAVCFVIKSGFSFPASFQKLIKLWHATFTSSLSMSHTVGYHIIHTEAEFGMETHNFKALREQGFRRLFPGLRATHHFVENKPRKKRPVSCYLAKVALANLFSSLSLSIGSKTDELAYPKLATHRFNELIIKNGLTELQQAYARDLYQVGCQLVLKRATEERLDKEIEECAKQVTELGENINGPYWDELETTAKGTCQASYEYFGDSTTGIVLSSPSGLPIDDVEYESVASKNGEWLDQEKTDTKVTAKLKVSSFWGASNVTGSITLKAKKRHTCSQELELKRRLCERNSTKLEALNKERTSNLGQMRVLESQQTKMQTTIQILRQDLQTMANATAANRGASLTIASFKDRLHCFTVSNPVSAARGYGLQSVVPKSRLPAPLVQVMGNQCATLLERRASEIKHMMEATLSAITAITADIERLSRRAQEIHAASSALADRADAHERRKDSMPIIQLTKQSIHDATGYSKRVLKETKLQASHVDTAAREIIDSEKMLVEQRGKALYETQQSLGKVLERMRQVREEWMLEKKYFELWLTAARVASQMAIDENLELGPFLVVKRVVEREDGHPFSILCTEIWEDMKAEYLLNN